MSTIHHPHTANAPRSGTATAEPPVEVGEPRREPMGRVIVGSIGAGFVAASVLTLGVFGGASEHVVSGVGLLAFAGGWAMLAVLSARFTSRSQRWARVPAAVMACGGVGLLVAQPDDHALDVAGWVWPPVILVLAVWIFVQLRRSMGGRVRWMLYPIVAAVAVGSVGAMAETAARAHDRSTYAAPGTLYDVGGRRVHLDCTGSGSPTVVLENGLGSTSVNWNRVTTAVGRTTRVCAYDRAGQGWSDDVDTPQDGLAIASDLHDVLALAGETGPYVLVGHSAGGPYVMTYAGRYPEEVGGMVLLDSMSPDEFADLPGFAAEQSMMRRGLGVLPSLARMGLGRIVPTSVWSSLPEPAASTAQAFASSARGMRNMRDEQSMYPTVFEQAEALTSLHGKPLVVVTATESIDKHQEWNDLQDRLAALSTNSRHRVADATHQGLIEDEATFESSVQAVIDVVESIRTSEPVTDR